MTILGMLLLVIGFSIFTIIFTVVILFRKDISAFFSPQNWVEITMLELDDNVRTWLQKKSKDLRFQFNEGKYNLFNSADSVMNIPLPNGQIQRQVKGGKTIYRSGRLARFFYIEGNPDPIDLRHMKTSNDAVLKEQLLKIDISQLFIDPKTNFQEIWDTIKPVVYIALVVIAIVVIIKMTGKPPEVQPQ